MENLKLHPPQCPDCGQEECICNHDHRLRHDASQDDAEPAQEEDPEIEDADQ